MTPLNRNFRAGVVALGLLGTSAVAADAQEAAPPMPATTPVPAPPNASKFAVLLLSNGRLLQGNVTESRSGDAYELRMNGGLIPVPKRDVAKRYGSLEELYRDRVAHLPARDSDERMKLALWCLEQHMDAQAREQLQGVREMNPADRRAERMMASIDANAQRLAARDPEVRVAGAEVVEPAPREMAATPLPRPRTANRGVERPVIFDLPPDAAMRRFVEFAWDVHPILQASCASCHNESFEGEYRLIVGKSRRDWTPDVVRANLDATLRFVRADDPEHSDLVAYATNAHGPSPRPVFHGPNDRRQQRLAAWLRSLRPADGVAASAPAQPTPLPAAPARGGFGSDRLAVPRATPVPPTPLTGPTTVSGLPGQNYTQHYEMNAVAPGVPADVRFDTPTVPGFPGSAPPGPGKPGGFTPPIPPAGAAKLPTLPPGTPVPPPDDVIPPTNRPKKRAQVDDSLFNQFLKSRQQAQP
jgi:hypothetical protein